MMTNKRLSMKSMTNSSTKWSKTYNHLPLLDGSIELEVLDLMKNKGQSRQNTTFTKKKNQKTKSNFSWTWIMFETQIVPTPTSLPTPLTWISPRRFSTKQDSHWSTRSWRSPSSSTARCPNSWYKLTSTLKMADMDFPRGSLSPQRRYTHSLLSPQRWSLGMFSISL